MSIKIEDANCPNAEKTVNADSTINGKSFVAEYLNMVIAILCGNR